MQALKKYYFGKQKTPAVLPFVSTWNTANTSSGSSASNQVKLPLSDLGTYNFTVNWGDGSSNTITVWNQAQATHTYSSSGTYTISVTGVCIGWVFSGIGDRLKLLSISSWGSLKLGNSGSYFFGCSNLNLSSVSDVLDLTGTTSFFRIFRDCSTLTTINNIGVWNTSSITNLAESFMSCSNFNQSLNTWNTTSLTGGLNNAFQSCSKLNQSFSTWNISNITSLANTFYQCTVFNGDITTWNTGNVTDMSQMFYLASAFNQNIGGWGVSKVTNMFWMFRSAIAFNQNIGSWNVSNCLNFQTFMNGKTSANFSSSNLDAIYNGWSSRVVKPNISIDFGTAKYTSASSAGRAILTGSPNNWTITDGGI